MMSTIKLCCVYVKTCEPYDIITRLSIFTRLERKYDYEWQSECIPGNVSQLLFPNGSEPNEIRYEEEEEDPDINFDDEYDVEDREEYESGDEE